LLIDNKKEFIIWGIFDPKNNADLKH